MAMKYMSGREVSIFLGVKEQTVCNWRRQGKGPPFQKFGWAVMYDPKEVKMYAENRAKNGRPKKELPSG
jgi:hypothetical protein